MKQRSKGVWPLCFISDGCARPRARPVTVPEWYHRRMAINLRLTDDEQRLLDGLAEESGLSKSEVLRRALVEKAIRDRRSARIDASLDWTLERYDDLLRRLGTA